MHIHCLCITLVLGNSPVYICRNNKHKTYEVEDYRFPQWRTVCVLEDNQYQSHTPGCMTFPTIGEQYHIEYSSNNFAKITLMSAFMTNCLNYFPMYRCSPIVGGGPEKYSKICPIVFLLFKTFSPRLENNSTLESSLKCFP